MKFAHFFIDRPVFASVLSIVIIIVGVISIFSLPIAQYPEIAPPTVNITAAYPGANAKVVADTVAAPIEQQVNGVENMLYMSSQCTNTGAMSLTVTFRLGTNLDVAQVQIQNRVAVAEPQLPEDVRRIGVTVKKASPDITLAVGLYSPDNSRDTLYISNYATTRIRDILARDVPGVGDILVFGAREYAMRLWLDPQKLAGRGITAGDFVTAVREQNVQVAAGVLGAQPLPPGTTKFQYTVTAQGRLTDPEEFADIVIKTGDDGRITRVRDVARVELGAADYSISFLYNGQPAVGIPIFQLPGTNAIATANAVYAKMKSLKEAPDWPAGLDYSIPYDTTVFVRNSIHDVLITLFEAIGLVVIVVLVFLQSWRASLVPLLAIPVSLIGTFAVMWATGFSINNLTLFGMVLAIGIVVDDAIVVVENIQRWIERGLSPRDAAYKAMTEVTGAVVAIACGLSAVFIPVAFVSGVTGQFYRQFALTIAFSTLLSAFNSLTLSPALAALLLKAKDAPRGWLTWGIDVTLGWFFNFFNWGLATATSAYVALLRRSLRLAALVLLVYVGFLFIAYLGFKAVPTGFIPPQDSGYVIAVAQLPDGATLDRTEAVMARVGEIAHSIPGVKDTVAVSGLSIFTFSNQSNAALMFVPLKDFSERMYDPKQSASAIVGQMFGRFSQIQEAMVFPISPPPVRGMGFVGGFKMQVQDRAGRSTPQELQAATGRLIAEARKDPAINGAKLFSSFRANVPQFYANVDRSKVKQQNVQITDVFQTLQIYLGSLYINDFNFLGRTFRVTAQADAPFRADVADILQLKTRNLAGNMVPLGAVLDIHDTTGPDRVSRYNLYRAAEINGEAAPGVSTGQAIAVMEDLAHKYLPPGYSFEWTELTLQEKLAGNSAWWIFPLCVLFVWLTHSAEYESFALSTAIILIVPMCLLCGIGGVWLMSSLKYFPHPLDNSIFTQIGFVVLAGLSAKNAVLIVEFAKQEQERGKNARDAALEAAHLRLRPILMTSFSFILGVLPLVLAKGAGSEMRHALGTVVFFGMLGVTFFGLFFTPVFFQVIRWATGRWVLPAWMIHESDSATPVIVTAATAHVVPHAPPAPPASTNGSPSTVPTAPPPTPRPAPPAPTAKSEPRP